MFVVCTNHGQHNEDVFGVLVWFHGLDGAQWVNPSSPPLRSRDPGMGTDHYRPGRPAPRIRLRRAEADERHAFLFVGVEYPEGWPLQGMAGGPEVIALPAAAPRLPGPIDGLWLASFLAPHPGDRLVARPRWLARGAARGPALGQAPRTRPRQPETDANSLRTARRLSPCLSLGMPPPALGTHRSRAIPLQPGGSGIALL